MSWIPASNCGSARELGRIATKRYYKQQKEKKEQEKNYPTHKYYKNKEHSHNTRSRNIKNTLGKIPEEVSNMAASAIKNVKAKYKKGKKKVRKYFGYVPMTATEEEEDDFVKKEFSYYSENKEAP